MRHTPDKEKGTKLHSDSKSRNHKGKQQEEEKTNKPKTGRNITNMAITYHYYLNNNFIIIIL